MVRLRENTHKPWTRHDVTTLLVRAARPTTTIRLHATVMVVGKRKEAAP
jgi:hypothetical protein